MSQVNPDEPVGYTLKRAATALRRAMDTELRVHDLTVPQYACLKLLAQHPGLTNARLAPRAFVSRQAMHQLLTGLRASGLVAGDGQGRKERFTITEHGLQRLAGASATVAAIEERMLSTVDLARRQRLQADLNECVRALEHAEPAATAPNA